MFSRYANWKITSVFGKERQEYIKEMQNTGGLNIIGKAKDSKKGQTYTYPNGLSAPLDTLPVILSMFETLQRYRASEICPELLKKTDEQILGTFPR